jgi:hypothetical protein
MKRRRADGCATEGAGCLCLQSLADLEERVGDPDVSHAMRAVAMECGQLGKCQAPHLCRRNEAPAKKRVATVVRFPLARRTPDGGGSRDPQRAAVIDFISAKATRRAEDDDGNMVARTPLSLDLARVHGNLAPLLSYWSEIASFRPPRLEDIDPIRIARTRLLGLVHMVNIANDDPDCYLVEMRGALAPSVPGTCGKGALISRHPVRILREAVAEDYSAARATARPAYAHIRSRLLKQSYSYRRLLLPFSSDGHRADLLMVAIDPH